jgi:hypothetical protein
MFKTAGTEKGNHMEASVIENIGVVSKPSQTALKRIANEIDVTKKLIWHDAECMSQWYALVEKPPLHSVVVHIEPVMATQLLRVANEKNRRLQDRHAARLSKVIQSENYELTGDTIKFSKTGRLLDGQHRLKACEKQGAPIISHVVFGLSDEIFDVLDQGKRRTAADVLGLSGVEYAPLVAATVNWVMWYKAGAKNVNEVGNARLIKQAALGEMKGIKDWTRLGMQLHAAYKQPPTLMTGLLYLIGKHNKGLAEEFAHAWLHGNRLGRNRNFDELSRRLQQIRNQSGGSINSQVRAALVIVCFNHWNAGIVASARSLSWKKELMFPMLEFDGQKFAKGRSAAEREDTSLLAVQLRIMNTLIEVSEGMQAKIGNAELAEKANVPLRQIPDLIADLVKQKKIAVATPQAGPVPATYEIIAFGKK